MSRFVFLIALYLTYVSRVLAESFNKIKACKHGTFLLNDFDSDISENMRVYGEWAEQELDLFLSLVNPGDIVIDAGANIGAFTVPLAKRVGKQGRVHSFEPQKVINHRLIANLVLNDLENVEVYLAALGNSSGTIGVPNLNYGFRGNYGALSLAESLPGQTAEQTYQVPLLRLDDIDFYNPFTQKSCPSFIKMDVERMEKWVLQGGSAMINRCRPYIHSENNAHETTTGLIDYLYDLNYIPYWDLKPAFNPNNFNGNSTDITEGYINMNIICVPKEKLKENGGTTVMVGFLQVQRDKPFLLDYQVVSTNGLYYLAQHY